MTELTSRASDDAQTRTSLKFKVGDKVRSLYADYGIGTILTADNALPWPYEIERENKTIHTTTVNRDDGLISYTSQSGADEIPNKFKVGDKVSRSDDTPQLKLRDKVVLKPGHYRESVSNPIGVKGIIRECQYDGGLLAKVDWDSGISNSYKHSMLELAPHDSLLGKMLGLSVSDGRCATQTSTDAPSLHFSENPKPLLSPTPKFEVGDNVSRSYGVLQLKAGDKVIATKPTVLYDRVSDMDRYLGTVMTIDGKYRSNDDKRFGVEENTYVRHKDWLKLVPTQTYTNPTPSQTGDSHISHRDDAQTGDSLTDATDTLRAAVSRMSVLPPLLPKPELDTERSRQYKSLLKSKNIKKMNTLRQNLRDRFFKKEESKIADLVEASEGKVEAIEELVEYLKDNIKAVTEIISSLENAIDCSDKPQVKKDKKELEELNDVFLDDELIRQLMMIGKKILKSNDSRA